MCVCECVIINRWSYTDANPMIGCQKKKRSEQLKQNGKNTKCGGYFLISEVQHCSFLFIGLRSSPVLYHRWITVVLPFYDATLFIKMMHHRASRSYCTDQNQIMVYCSKQYNGKLHSWCKHGTSRFYSRYNPHEEQTSHEIHPL